MHLPPEVAEPIVEKIVDDLKGRSGLGNMWEEIDEETREEIKETWRLIIENLG